jgi:hypothetical protein
VHVKPGGQVSTGEDGKGAVVVVEGVELSLVVADLVTGLGPALKLRDVAVGSRGDKVLGTSAEEDIDTSPGVPGEVTGDSVEVLLNNGIVLRALGGV